MDSGKIKIFIVDDSLVARSLLKFIFESDPELEVIGDAANGQQALKLLSELNPDVITMDIAMPQLNGFETTRKIMQTDPHPIVIVSGLYSKDNATASFQALELGAVALVSKPVGVSDPKYHGIAKELINTIKYAANIKVHRQEVKRGAQGNLHPDLKTVSNIAAIGIGSSLGGPKALATILSKLPNNFPVPIFIAQHIATGFATGLCDWLQQTCHLKIQIAQDNERAIPGNIYLPPDEFHLEIGKNNTMHLVTDPSSTAHPSIARLFSSMANNYGPSAIGVILTGMGQDGAKELLQMRQKGAITIAQDEESSLMFGMPQVAIKLNAASYVLPLDNIVDVILKLLN